MTNLTAFLIATVCLYSTGHWIGATVLLVVMLHAMLQAAFDPSGEKRVNKLFSFIDTP